MNNEARSVPQTIEQLIEQHIAAIPYPAERAEMEREYKDWKALAGTSDDALTAFYDALKKVYRSIIHA